MGTSVFEPDSVKDILKLTLNGKEKGEFDSSWKKNVKNRLDAWTKRKENQSKLLEQLQWEAEVVEYVDFVHKQTSVRANSSKAAPPLKKTIPLFGPKFIPPTYTHAMRRQNMPNISPQTSYLIPLIIIHPFYYPTLLTNCPQCNSTDILWDSWTATGAREVHGVRCEERALGYQMRCKTCRGKYGKGGSEEDSRKGYCFATTSKAFWESWPSWKIPRDVPYFHFRCAVTHELFDLIIELRPSSTSSGLADHIEQLHLLEYWQEMRDYLLAFIASASSNQSTLTFQRSRLEMLSSYDDKSKYNGNSISNDLVTDIYLDFVRTSRKEESENYCKSRKAQSVSMDNTFKSAGKAVVVDKDKERVKMMKGGVLSAINEVSETLSWRFCQSASPAEIGEMLDGIAERCKVLGIPCPESAVVDNCCAVRNKIKGAMPEIHVILDVYHFLMRYLAVITNGKQNEHRSAVAKDIRDAIIRTPAAKGQPATYWPQDVQVQRLELVYKQWQDNGSVWASGAAKVHLDQMAHVKKGCLARHRDDISMDGSRIEGSHKGWNSLQRAQPSGLEVYASLAHDFVHRRNIRIGRSLIAKNKRGYSNELLSFTGGSHHTALICSVAELFNGVHEKRKWTELSILPTLPIVPSGESFGLVVSEHTQSFGGLFLEAKDEAEDDIDEDDSAASMLDQIDLRIEDIDTSNLDVSNHLTGSAAAVIEDGNIPVHPTGQDAVPDSSQVPSSKRKLDESINGFDDIGSTGKRPKISGSVASGTLQALSPPHALSIESSTSQTASTTQMLDNQTEQQMPDQTQHSAALTPAALTPAAQSRASATGLFFGISSAEPLPPSRPAAIQKPCGASGLLQLHDAQTRSQKLFELATQTKPESLSIKTDVEFFLFMEMRIEHQWKSFGMTARKWANVTTDYNKRLASLCKEKGCAYVAKNTRALMDKLGSIEPEISRRINSQNFKSQSGSETFWKKQCTGVPLLLKQEPQESALVPPNGTKPRKLAVCSRCKTMMYPGSAGDSNNHKKGYCADGVAQKAHHPGDELPDWPQPAGIFKRGTHFHASKFLQAVRELYDKVIDRSVQMADYSMEDEAFSRMLQSRTTIHDPRNGTGQILFRLYANLENEVTIDSSILVEIDGIKYLRIDSLDTSEVQ